MMESVNGPYSRNCDFDCRLTPGHCDDVPAGAVESFRALTGAGGKSGGLPLWSVYGQGVGVLILMLGGSVLYLPINMWGMVLMVLGAVPALWLTRDHNRRLDGDFGPEAL